MLNESGYYTLWERLHLGFFCADTTKIDTQQINEERGGMKSIHTADQTYTQSVTTKHVTWHHSSDSDSNII